MRETTHHRVDGVGKQVPANESRPFNPRDFEQAIHGLQELLLEVVRFDDHEFEDGYDPGHEQTVEDGQKVIRIQPDTILHDVCRMIPQGWDTSILNDLQNDHSYAVWASVDCGGGVLVVATIFVQFGVLSRMHIQHSMIGNPEEDVEYNFLSNHEASFDVSQIHRNLDRAVTRGYSYTIDSAATAFDYTATKSDISSTGKRDVFSQVESDGNSQSNWANIRGKTRQTVSDNVRNAREQLLNLPDSSAFDTSEPALEELDPDADEDGDIRLVRLS